jgi:adenylyltransferase/sulfurtransferase
VGSAAVRVSDNTLAELYAHARETFPDECCGYVRRNGEVVRCRNAQSDGEHPTHPERGPETGFVITGRDLFEFARAFSTESPPVVVYHSHTNGRAYFSEVDRMNARGDTSPIYDVQDLVIGVTSGGVTEAAQFAWDAAVGDFVEVARWDARC